MGPHSCTPIKKLSMFCDTCTCISDHYVWIWIKFWVTVNRYLHVDKLSTFHVIEKQYTLIYMQTFYYNHSIEYMCMVYDTYNSSFTPVRSRLMNVMSDGRLEFRTEGRQIYRYRFLNVNTVHFIVYLYIPISKAKMNFNVQYIINRIDSILFAANIQL